MLGAGLQFNRSRNGDDRVYSAARARRSQSQSQRHRSHDHLRRAQTDVGVVKPESRAAADESPRKNKEVTGAAKKPAPSCNLERFLESVTPSVTAQCLSKTTMRGWRMCGVEFQHYFVLGDLWESFKEWSAYGAGVPLILNDSDSVIQYYVPYLSGIQLYVDSSKTSVKSRRLGEDSDGDSFRDSSSDGSSDCEQDRGSSNALMGAQMYYHQTSDVSCRLDWLSMRDQHLALQEGFSSDDGESGSSQVCLLFEYLEQDQPYSREPLYDKISDLALRFPQLKTLRSCDLLSSSWISVAWYPIYRIPMGPTLKDLDACFLTFHCLHTPTTGPQNGHAPVLLYPSEVDGVAKMLLPVFGLASYKFRGSLWTPDGGYEHQLVNSLLQAADNWLAVLQVNHPDFLFFRRR